MESIVGKGETAGDQHFLSFSHNALKRLLSQGWNNPGSFGKVNT